MKKAITSIIFITLAVLLGCFILFSENLCSANDLKEANKQGYEIGFNNSDSYKNQLDTLKTNYNDLSISYDNELDKNQKLILSNAEHKGTIDKLETELKNTAKLEENTDYISANELLESTEQEYAEIYELFGNCSVIEQDGRLNACNFGVIYKVGTPGDGKTYLITSLSGSTIQVAGGYWLDVKENKYTIKEVTNE